MPYFTDVASSTSDLLTRIRTRLTTDIPTVLDRYTLSGDVLHKGDLYVSITDQTTHLLIQGGTGIDGSNNLTGFPPPSGSELSPRYCSLGPVGSPSGLQFPVTYFLHTNVDPDEIYLVVRDNTNRYSHMFFGKSPVSTLTATGNWFYASSEGSTIGRSVSDIGVGDNNNTLVAARMIFTPISPTGTTFNSPTRQNSFFQHGLDGNLWTHSGTGVGINDQTTTQNFVNTETIAFGTSATYPLFTRNPNQYNDQIVLIPCSIYVNRPSGFVSMVGQLEHFRYCRNDNYDDEAVVTIGTDRFRLYPAIRKNISARNGGVNITHSGTYGYALRYDGP